MFMLNVCSLAVTNSWMYALLNCIMKMDCNFHLVGWLLSGGLRVGIGVNLVAYDK